MAGIYIHIPFCESKCAYCNFFSLASTKRIDDFVEALKREIVSRKSYLGDEIIDTIYFGGGTPSLLSIDKIDEILKCIDKIYSIKSDPEITLEVNPDTMEREQLFSLKHIGINRVSLGIQSFFDEDLRYLERRHNSKHALQLIDDLVSIAFEKSTLDLIYGIPTLTEEKWNKNIDIFLSTGIKHLSSYALTVEPKTILHQRIESGKCQGVSEESAINHYNILIKRLKENDFEHYEISNFAKENHRSLHNCLYWNDGHYVGFGPSAHSYDGKSRQWNVSNLTRYIDNDFDNDVCFEKEFLTRDDKYNEYVMTSLRTSWGCSIEKIHDEYGAQYSDYFLKNVRKYVDEGKMIVNKDRFRLSEEGLLFADGIAADLFL